MSEEVKDTELITQNQQYQLDTTDNEADTTGIILPDADDVNDAIVYKNVKDVCRGFSFDANEIMEKKFLTVEQICNYIEATNADVDNMCQKAEASERLHQAAAMARYWYMSYSVHKALANGDYGTNCCGRIAAQLGKSIPMIYSITHVGERLTASDCYLLGFRRITRSTLRHLAEIKDDSLRKGLIDAFVKAYADTSNPEVCAKLVMQFKQAIKLRADPQFLLTSTSDPIAGGSEVMVTELYTSLIKQFSELEKILKRVNKEKFLEAFVDACENFSMTDSIPDAEEHVESVKQQAQELKEKCQIARNNLEELIQQLDSLSGVEVISDESSNGSSNK